jgi:hypothetical protein
MGKFSRFQKKTRKWLIFAWLLDRKVVILHHHQIIIMVYNSISMVADVLANPIWLRKCIRIRLRFVRTTSRERPSFPSPPLAAAASRKPAVAHNDRHGSDRHIAMNTLRNGVPHFAYSI